MPMTRKVQQASTHPLSSLHPGFQRCRSPPHLRGRGRGEKAERQASLVALWFRIRQPMQATTGSISGPGSSYTPRSKQACVPQLQSLCTENTEPCAPRSPHSSTREVRASRTPRTTTREEPLLTKNRESPHAPAKTHHIQMNIFF